MADVRRSAEDRTKKLGITIDYGPHLALVVNNQDSLYSGRLQVWIPSFGGDATSPSSWHTVSYASPFYGITPYSATQKVTNTTTAEQFRANESNPLTAGQLDSTNRQTSVKSFGMWTQPPDLGTRVLVVFADGSVDKGFWIAAVPEVAHGMIPAIGKGASGQPEAEFDPASSEVQTSTDIRKVTRPPLTEVAATYSAQGLDKDPLRGFISTSSFRESPSKVMGFSTPSNHSFVMDDGDESGQSKLIRIRTASGNQITMHDDTGMIYLINAKGTGWLELSPEGNIDIFGQAGINLASAGDVNIHADKDVNIHAGNNLKMIAMAGAKIQGTKELQLMGAKTYLEGVDSIEMHSCGEIKITSFKDIFIKSFNFLVAQAKCFRWNSGTAKEAEQVPPEKPATVSGYNTTVKRAPSHEPYDQHGSGAVAGPASAAAAGATPQQAAAIQAAGGAQPGQFNPVNIPAGVSFVDPTQAVTNTITVATREEAIALAKTAPAGTVINYGQQLTAAGVPNTTLGAGSNNGAVGAIVGGIIGSRFGQGSGNTIATAAGAVAGRLIAGGGTFTEGDVGGIVGGVLGNQFGKGNPLATIAGTIVGQSLGKSLFTGGNLQSTIAENAARYIPVSTARPTAVPTLGGGVDGPKPSATVPSTSLTTNNTTSNASVTPRQSGATPATSAFQGGPNAGANTGGVQTGIGSPGVTGVADRDRQTAPATGSTTTNADGTTANPSMAAQQLSGAEPATSIPAAVGGGSTGFAKGDNCARPAGQGAAGMSGGAGGNASAGVANRVPPESLKNDPAFQAKLAEMKSKYPGLTDQQIYNVIGGESGFDFAAVNADSGATGAFQFIPSTAASLGYTTAQIQAMNPAEQLAVYDQYLAANKYPGGSLGIMQAAPAYANRPGNTVVYPQGSAAWNQNPGWRGPNGLITVDSINAYYAKQGF
jgi:hypothetical protein